jgi:adenylylsulfate kinase
MKSKHIIPHSFYVDRKKREELKNHPAFLIWFTGLSGSGKSTIASRLEEELYNRGYHTYILDGDNVRSGLNSDLDFTDKGREENIRRIGEVANLFVDAGIIVMASFISPFRQEREFVKSLVGASRFFEVFVDCPLDECESRDVKGLYKKARAGEIPDFTGISSPYEAPENPDITIDTSLITVDEAIAEIIDNLEDRFDLNV